MTDDLKKTSEEPQPHSPQEAVAAAGTTAGFIAGSMLGAIGGPGGIVMGAVAGGLIGGVAGAAASGAGSGEEAVPDDDLSKPADEIYAAESEDRFRHS